jgi:hypothetical protein
MLNAGISFREQAKIFYQSISLFFKVCITLVKYYEANAALI